MTLVLWRRRLWTQKKEKKAYETGLCILLFNGDRQVSSVNCPSALWYLLPIFAGFRIYLKSIWALQKRGTSSFCHHDRRASITRGSLSIWRSKKLSQWPNGVWDHTNETHKKVTFSLILHCSDQLALYKYVYVCDLFLCFYVAAINSSYFSQHTVLSLPLLWHLIYISGC